MDSSKLTIKNPKILFEINLLLRFLNFASEILGFYIGDYYGPINIPNVVILIFSPLHKLL